MTMTSPALMVFAMIAFRHSGSESNTRAGPVIDVCFNPVILATQPSGERLPFKMVRCPCLYSGLGHGLAVDCRAITVQDAIGEQHLQHLRNAADGMEIRRHVRARGFQIA